MGARWWDGLEILIEFQLKSHLFPAETLAEVISMTHSDMLYRLDDSTFNFYEPLLLQDLWETYKNLGLPLSTITFLVNSHADNHFYNYICFTYYTVFMKYKFRLFIFKFKCETPLFFLVITMVSIKDS